MKPYLKLLVIGAFCLIAIQYWMLADISQWLVCDSYACDVFPKYSYFLAGVTALIWGADIEYGGRYIVIVMLGVLLWWILSRPQKDGSH